MILAYSVTNFKSFEDVTVLSFEATPDKAHEETLLHCDEECWVLPSIAVYGPNAAGKSNLLDSMQLMKSMICGDFSMPAPNEPLQFNPFAYRNDAPHTDTKFELAFMLEGIKYEYSFSYNKDEITKEHLLFWRSSRPTTVFERDSSTETPISFPKGMKLGNLKKIASMTNANRLFLRNAVELGDESMLPVYEFFKEKIHYYSEESKDDLTTNILRDSRNAVMRQKIVEYLSKADVGIANISASANKEDPDNPIILFTHTVERDGRKYNFAMNMEGESRGTQKLYNILGHIVDALEYGKFLFVDELGFSYHPLIAQYVIEIFNDPELNLHNAQLLFTTHNTTLLNLEKMRRDQIWFVEKNDRTQTSELYPLSDYSPRKNENIERGYLLGRYGAIPFFGR